VSRGIGKVRKGGRQKVLQNTTGEEDPPSGQNSSLLEREKNQEKNVNITVLKSPPDFGEVPVRKKGKGRTICFSRKTASGKLHADCKARPGRRGPHFFRTKVEGCT